MSDFEVCDKPERNSMGHLTTSFWTQLVLKLAQLEPEQSIRVKFSEMPGNLGGNSWSTPGARWAAIRQRLHTELVNAGLYQRGFRPDHGWGPEESIYIWLKQ